MSIYLIPGLGFDHRIFERLDLGNATIHYLDWIEPEIEEGLAAYAQRMAQLVKGENIVLIGHSFGGVVAQEIAQIISIKQVILVSSIRAAQENPWHLKMFGKGKWNKILTKKRVDQTIKFWGSTHGYSSKEEKALVRSMVNRYSNHYLQWALKQLGRWKGIANRKVEVFQIHGSLDKTFPIKKLKKVDHIIEDGGHFMVYKQSVQLSNVIRKIISLSNN